MEINTTDLIHAHFTPVYDQRLRAFNTYYCTPQRAVESLNSIVVGETLLGLGVEDKQINEQLVLENMLGTVRQGIEKAREFAYTDGGEKVIVPINGMALTNKETASAFTEFCKSYPNSLLQGIVFDVTNIGDTAAMGFLDDIAIVLYLFCCTYSCRVSPATKDYSYFATCNYHSVSFSLGNKKWPLDKLSSLLETIHKRAEESRLKIYLHGIADAETRAAAEAAGIRYLDGDGVRPN